MSTHTIITLDGPAGVGKSTLAKALARELQLPFLDTGAMFRYVAHALGEDALKLDGPALAARLETLDFDLKGSGDNSILACNGQVPGNEIRTEQVGKLASKFAALPEVRDFLKTAQQRLGNRGPLVAEGRDMGTVVFPQAARKFFLDADPLVRAKRRQLQLLEQGADKRQAANAPAPGSEEELRQIEAQIRERDHQDRNRAIAPLRPAEDAIIVDTSNLSLDQVLAKLLDSARSI
ncbi:(d)CMP kinase [Desulfovibrio sp. OttesenSCG-928-C06]|nr:(d)CMP kinase [Desulfovibrio sp. OttesenSCG-928-C06]